MATRGRPKRVVTEPPVDYEIKAAQILADRCGIPGCGPQNHLEEVRALSALIQENLNKHTKGTSN